VGEIDHGQNAVNHRVAQGNQRVNAAQLQCVENLLKNIGHKIEKITSLYFPFLIFLFSKEEYK